MDICTDDMRSNSLCPQSITAKEDTLRVDLSGLKMICNPPFCFAYPFIFACEEARRKDKRSDVYLVLPFWAPATCYWTQRMLKSRMWRVLCVLPAGQEMFSTPCVKNNGENRYDSAKREVLRAPQTHHVVYVFADTDAIGQSLADDLLDIKKQLGETHAIKPSLRCPH